MILLLWINDIKKIFELSLNKAKLKIPKVGNTFAIIISKRTRQGKLET